MDFSEIPKESLRKLTRNEKKAVSLVSKDPTKSSYRISKELIDLGYVQNETYLSDRLRKNSELAGIVAICREKNLEKLHKDLTPKALDHLEKALDSKHISKKDRFKYIKLTLDKSFGDDGSAIRTGPTQINIENLQVYLKSRHNEMRSNNSKED